MPARKRSRSRAASSTSPAEVRPERSADDEVLARFAAALKESEARERAEKERQRAERAAADALDEARRELERAIRAVKDANRTRVGIPEADATWRAAKARVIELETGETPDWAPPADDAHDADDSADPGDPDALAAHDEPDDDSDGESTGS